jgi:flagellar biosynthesis/type III secretory pathway protein FliH
MALLSSRHAEEVRTFVGARPPAAPAPHPLEAECAALRGQLGEANAAIVNLRREHAREIEKTFESGRREGLARAESNEAARLAALEKALADAVRIFDQKLVDLERLAAELAEVALTRLLDHPAAQTRLSASFIARQVAELEAAGIVRIRVSTADFADEASLAELATRLCGASGTIEIVRETELAGGQAALDCRLGKADLDLARQWQSLAAVLRDMARV